MRRRNVTREPPVSGALMEDQIDPVRGLKRAVNTQIRILSFNQEIMGSH